MIARAPPINKYTSIYSQQRASLVSAQCPQMALLTTFSPSLYVRLLLLALGTSGHEINFLSYLEQTCCNFPTQLLLRNKCVYCVKFTIYCHVTSPLHCYPETSALVALSYNFHRCYPETNMNDYVNKATKNMNASIYLQH